MPRLFVGLSLPNSIVERLASLQNGVQGARWRPIENFHLTLAFIGEVDPHAMQDAIEVLADIDAPSFALQLSGIGSFGDKKPRALWADVKTSSGLMHLQRKIDTALRQRDFALEDRKFTPHVTLAYLKGTRRDDVQSYSAVNGLFSSEEFFVDRFHLYSSVLGGGASHYEIEASYALSSSPSSSSI